VRFIPVELGIATPERTEILAPEIEGLVVSLGQHLLEDGSTVILPDVPPGKTQAEAAEDIDAQAGSKGN